VIAIFVVDLTLVSVLAVISVSVLRIGFFPSWWGS
jgi:hypothetical protein